MDELTAAALPPAPSASDDLQPVAPAYRNVIRARMAVTWLIVWIGAAVLDRLFLDATSVRFLPTVGIAMIALVVTSTAPGRIYDRLRYRLTGRFLQVLRGWLFHVDTIVPLVRVQHIDVTRGPFDKLFGTASLVVHTAGTHNSIVVLPGLAPDSAAAIRDIIREEVRTDFA